MKRLTTSLFLALVATSLLFSQYFSDVTTTAGLNLNNIRVVAVFDYNNDGYQDLAINYFNGSKAVYTLMKNNGNKTFTDAGSSIGFPNNEIMVFDYDNDGYSDLAVIDTFNLRIYRNEHGIFKEYTQDLGIINPFFIEGEAPKIIDGSIQVHDFDKDGDLDITFIRKVGTVFSLSAIENNYIIKSFNTKVEIIPSLPSTGVNYAFFDMDNDFDLDVVGSKVGSQFSISTMHLWRNDDGVYTDVTSGSGLVNCYPRALLTVDFNNDGYLDIIKGGADGGGGNDYRVFLNDKDGTFTDASAFYTIRNAGQYYYRPSYIDFDNDFDNDIHWESIASMSDGRMKLFQNDGNLNFMEVSSTYGVHLGSTIGGVPIKGSTPSVFFDYDNDGDLDVFISDFRFNAPYGGVGYMMENQIGGNYLKVKANGCSTNRDAKGVKITANIGSESIILYNSQGVNTIGGDKSNLFHFGLGTNSKVDKLTINWQNGGTTILNDVTANQTLTVNEVNNCPIWNGCTVFDTTYITVYDTIKITVYDTTHIAVTDTLIIDVLLSDINPIENMTTITAYPNPTKEYLYIRIDDYMEMDGFMIKIFNNLGSLVYETQISEQFYEINLSTWTGKGTYFIQVLNPDKAIKAIKKIILQ